MPLRSIPFDELDIQDESSFSHVAVYAQLRRALRASGSKFRVASAGSLSWDRATFLNLTFWNPDEGGDVLCDNSIAADVIAHIAWHHVCASQLNQLAPSNATQRQPPAALFFGEAIASAFDLYLIGRLLPNVPDADMLLTQVPIMREAAEEAGLADEDFEVLLESVVKDPERAFEDLRALLFDVSRALFACATAADAQLVFERFAGHRFEPLLHHFQLSNWVLYARAYGADVPEQQRAILELDAALRAAPVSLDWLAERWLADAK